MFASNRIQNDEEKREISILLEKLRAGLVCVHPTDTIPGLSCDPWKEEAVRALEKSKKRTQKKSFVGLVSSFDHAVNFWKELPLFWQSFIPRIWPAPISFVWKARENVPSCLVSAQGELALRFPQLAQGAEWFYEVMDQMKVPLPSTSINYEEHAPIFESKDLKEFCERHAIYLPKLLPSSKQGIASSVVRILDGTRYEFLRVGAYSEKDFQDIYASLRKENDDGL